MPASETSRPAEPSVKSLSRPALAYRKLLVHYYDLLIPVGSKVLEIGCGSGELLRGLTGRDRSGIDKSATKISLAQERDPEIQYRVLAGEDLTTVASFDYIIVSDTLNLIEDVQALLEHLRKTARPDARLLINIPNTLWRPWFRLADGLGWRAPQSESNWLSGDDVHNLLDLAGWDLIKLQPRALFPLSFGWFERLINRSLAPLLPWFCCTVFAIARPRPKAGPFANPEPSVSVLVPARNEAGNIEAAINRTPSMGAWTEFIFVEGGSSDQTWSEIQRVANAFPGHRIKISQQSGRGKGNAVREGFAQAEGDILMILDADLTMPPEELPKYYEAVVAGHCDFANGCRLVYPMESEAMRFLNMIANKAFGILFSWILSQKIKDTLCGTKVMTRENYLRIAANRDYFGDFDPYGDFDLLFGADKLNLKIRDIPIRYRDRTYGSTNINRWSGGWLLLRMVVFAARKLKFV